MIFETLMAIIEALRNWTMKEPGLFGWFHITFLVLILITTFLLIKYFRNSSEKVMKRIVLISYIILVVFEIGKQILSAVFYEGIRYGWNEFPLQFCETPLYVLPLLLLIKNKKVQNSLIAYMATYVIFAGFALTIIPLELYSDSVFFNIRTMVEHGLQMILGLYLFAWNRKNINFKDFIGGTIVFFIFVGIAMAYNFVVGHFKENINMFWFAKDYDTPIIVLKNIKPHVPYIVFVLLYLICFISLAFASYMSETLVYKLCLKCKKSRESTNAN